jgi:GH43 family beta-xylosidase
MGSSLAGILSAIACVVLTALLATPAEAQTQSSFRNPVLPLDASGNDSPDPWLFRHDGKYWINYTSDGQLVYRSARVLDGLADAPEHRIWPPAASTEPAERSAELWAPETHLIDGRWYVYYTATEAGTGINSHRIYVLQSKTDSPAGPYRFKAELSLPQPYAIDGTVFTLKGKLYLAYSGGPLFTPASIYLTELSDPWTVKGLPIEISTPEYDWEKQTFAINEGPEALIHGGKLNLIFSASWCGSGLYALGRLTVPSSSNPTDPDTWTDSKFPDPVFETDPARGVYGPGHGSFFSTNGGKEWWNVYHATDEAGKGCFTGGLRTTRVQRFTWNRDGTPRFGDPVSLGSDLVAPTPDRTIAIQAEQKRSFQPSARATRIEDRRFFGYAGMTLNPKGGKLPAMKFGILRKGSYRLYLRVLGGPQASWLKLVRSDGRKISRRLARPTERVVNLDLGRVSFNQGRRFLRLRSNRPVTLDQIRLQPERK